MAATYISTHLKRNEIGWATQPIQTTEKIQPLFNLHCRAKFSKELRIGFILAVKKGKKKKRKFETMTLFLGGWLVTSGNLERIPVSSEQPLNSRITSPDKSDEIASKFLLSLFGKWLVAGGYLINLPSTGRHVRKLFTWWKWINILEEPNFLSIQTCYCCVWSYSMHIFNILIIQSKAREINKL